MMASVRKHLRSEVVDVRTLTIMCTCVAHIQRAPFCCRGCRAVAKRLNWGSYICGYTAWYPHTKMSRCIVAVIRRR
eukprot:IDg18378t1